MVTRRSDTRLNDVALEALDALVQRMQQPVNVGRMVRDAEGAPDDLRHPLAGPHLATEAVRLCPALQQRGKLGQLRGGALGSGTR
jgi:hypothetical protein